MADRELDRNEAATPFKLQKARQDGQTPRSADAVAGAAFLAGMLYLASQGLQLGDALLRIARSAFVRAPSAGPEMLWPTLAAMGSDTAAVLLPFLLVLPVAAVLAGIAQTGFVFSAKPLHADFERISPASGWRRVFSLRTLFDGVRVCAKLLVLGTVAVLALQALVPQFHWIAALPAAAFLRVMAEDATSLGLKMGLALVALGALDVFFTRREFARKMRMSRRELKDEYKNREGDPRIRVRLRELRRELLKRSRALRNTRNADVVLTNPTHYAVALRYVHGEMEAPRVVAKGAGKLAAAMREIAARHRVIVVQNPPLARRLFRHAALDAYIPSDFHAEVARIVVWVMAARRQRAATTGGRG
jgi:flagellar biosynthetic protein FlhB